MTGRPPVPLPPARWPSQEEAEASLLYSPCRLGPRWARERSWVPAMVPWRATEEGTVTEANLAWYERFATGRPGVLVAEATGIRDVPSGPLLRIGHDRFVPGLRAMVRSVRRASGGRTLFFLQVLDFLAVRRRPRPEAYFGRHLRVRDAHRAAIAARTGDPGWRTAPEADVRAWLLAARGADHEAVLDAREIESLRMGYRERVTDLHLPHVRDLPRRLPGLFAAAAVRAVEAGFDGVELHFAHAYTMASFLSRTNDRGDGYGGSRAGRVRLALEVIEAVRARIGRAIALGARFLVDDVVAGGSRVEDASWYALRFAEAGLDFLSLSKGGRFEDAKQPRVGEAVYPYTGRSGAECMPTVRIDDRGPFGRNVPLVAVVRRAVRAHGFSTPVIAAGGISTFDQAEAVLRLGYADFVASARQSLADPDWWRKVRAGEGGSVRRCAFTNYCEGLDQRHRAVTCKLWDRAFSPDDPTVALSPDGHRRLVAPAWTPGSSTGPSPSAAPDQSSGRT